MIPNSLISTKILLDGYINLKDTLNEQCNKLTCPHIQIRYEIRYQFSDRYKTYQKKRAKLFCDFCSTSWETWNSNCICPCRSNKITPENVFLRLDEVIEELEQKLKKEYSS